MDYTSGRLARLRARGDARPAPAEALLAALPTPIMVVDESGVILDANAAAETLLNLSRSVVIGMAIDEATGHHLRTMPTDTPFVAYDLDISLPGNRHLRGDLLAAPLPDWPGWRIVALHAYPTAVPIARRAGGNLAAAGAAALLAHEIKNPLSGIRGAAQLLDANADAESRALTRLIRDEVDRVTALLDRMEGFTDTRPLSIGPQNIHAILEHARAVAAQGFGNNVLFREVYDPSLPPVLGHKDSLIQIVINLLKNAAEALGEKGGVVTLTTAYRHGMRMVTDGGDGRRQLPIEVCVIDDGPGAPPEIAEHLFDPFVSSKRDGRGLGLALVEKLVADQGGIVEYAREGIPERTVFRLLLQRARGK
ncbi:two-component system sensor histidine kinase NtrB [Sphingomonas sp.]|uniref:two-component system sensor histidine kinase NtrB n=1 Tax=Sphingomonas sp. TaxID=28214 RepID=UPI003B3A7168